MEIDVSNTISLWQLIVSIAVFILTSVAFVFAYRQWQNDNFLNIGKEIINLEERFSNSIQELEREAKDSVFSLDEIENRRQNIVINLLDRLNMYAFYFLKGTYNPMVDEYFMASFKERWEKPDFKKYIDEVRVSNPESFKSLERLVSKMNSRK